MCACVTHEANEEAAAEDKSELTDVAPDGRLPDPADERPGTADPASFQYWIMYSVIRLLPSVRDGVHVREIPLLHTPSIVRFRGAEGTSVRRQIQQREQRCI